MIGEWENAWSFQTPSGTLTLNSLTSYLYLLEASGCDGGVDLRVTEDNVPQGDGEIPHRAFTSGYKIRLLMQLRTRINPTYAQAEAKPACNGDITDMLDALGLHINEILNQAATGNQRLVWTPTGKANRMLDQIRLLERPLVTRTESDVTRVAFAVFSPFPYYLSEADTTTSFTAGSTHTIANGGTAAYYPVMKVYGTGATYPITITNNTNLDDDGNPLVIVYNSALPGAIAIPPGHYAEINTFKNTIYEDGSGANLKAGIDIQASDFFSIRPGGDSITISGASMDFISASAWR